jgi:hypothetical protein
MDKDGKIYTVEVEVLAAIEKVPADREFLEERLNAWERDGELALSVACNRIMLESYDSRMSVAVEEMRLLREALENTTAIGTAKLAVRFCKMPELIKDFSVFVDEEDKTKIAYRDSTKQSEVFEAFDNLHLELVKFYGFKEVSHQTLSQAIIKAHHWRKIETKQLGDLEKKTLILTKAECMLLRKRAKKITIPELKTYLLPLEESTTYIKNTLLDAGWSVIKSGTCKTPFYTILNQHN